jgi:hypothetical protein
MSCISTPTDPVEVHLQSVRVHVQPVGVLWQAGGLPRNDSLPGGILGFSKTP